MRRLEGRYSSQEGSKIPTWLTVSPVYKLYSTQVKTRFRVWCLIVLRSMETNIQVLPKKLEPNSNNIISSSMFHLNYVKVPKRTAHQRIINSKFKKPVFRQRIIQCCKNIQILSRFQSLKNVTWRRRRMHSKKKIWKNSVK